MRTSRLPRGWHRPYPARRPDIPAAWQCRPARRARSARTACPSTVPGRCSFLKLLDHAGYQLEEIADQAVVGHLEDRRFLILVDGHDHPAVLHARQVLDRARDPDRYVEVRRDDLAGLPDLPVVRHEAGIDGRARRAHRRAQLVRKRLEHLLEVLAIRHAAPARDDDLRGSQFGPLRFGDLASDKGRLAAVRGGANGLDLPAAAG